MRGFAFLQLHGTILKAASHTGGQELSFCFQALIGPLLADVVPYWCVDAAGLPGQTRTQEPFSGAARRSKQVRLLWFGSLRRLRQRRPEPSGVAHRL